MAVRFVGEAGGLPDLGEMVKSLLSSLSYITAVPPQPLTYPTAILAWVVSMLDGILHEYEPL